MNCFLNIIINKVFEYSFIVIVRWMNVFTIELTCNSVLQLFMASIILQVEFVLWYCQFNCKEWLHKLLFTQDSYQWQTQGCRSYDGCHSFVQKENVECSAIFATVWIMQRNLLCANSILKLWGKIFCNEN